jgi:hypothetical protein
MFWVDIFTTAPTKIIFQIKRIVATVTLAFFAIKLYSRRFKIIARSFSNTTQIKLMNQFVSDLTN